MIIKLEHITKSYENSNLEVLKDINFSVKKGETIAIIGPSGSGKSTLLNIMGSLDKPSSGNVFIADTDLTTLNDNQLAGIRNKKVGFIFQLHHLLPQLTALENVLLPLMMENDIAIKASASKRAMELFGLVGLADKMNRLPSQLSVGECQRVAVVRALINNPEIILADEPTGSLDEESALKLVDLLIELNMKQNFALIMVTHSKELAAKLETVNKLNAGQLKQV